ncbi:cob(I)yrinic acid a,c-diamide adenosyltransferase [Actinomadura madurae]|uniref:Corrinoid adenosyltransferase n=1 Tax=Actinomadura madurae TaxID=1993 RepID=A0A1I5XDW7_9ACTN|nr:cob(I)yrinic acid a,c-diamide adenosyltransferase [Actinomadura madurae]SFQ30056.1 ATP:cob(I)alamin adenosyltransferase [Actinomadura madurae]SPT59041.1 Cob(I)yrinic acid a,c-diamide adenosyltransferase [Actinomadura madurae]
MAKNMAEDGAKDRVEHGAENGAENGAGDRAGDRAKNRDNPVVLSRIYTRTGDDGTTALGDASRTRKTDPRLAAYADVEEANAAIGAALALGALRDDLAALLTRVQNDLFDVGADLCAPVVPDPQYPPLRVEQSYVERLEAACDEHNADLPALRSFILPGGAPGAALLHVARTVTRRAERSAWAAIEEHGTGDDGGVNPLTATYLNRLSDLLFILCRVANAEHGDILWKPGGER